MIIRWYGTASLSYESKSGRILLDPFKPLKGSKYQLDISEYDGYSDILITHGHFDHIVNLPEIIKRNKDTIIHCTVTPYNTLLNKGINKDNLHLIDYGDELNINGFNIKVIHGRHAILPSVNYSLLKRIFTSGNLDNLPYILIENNICKENDETVMFEINIEDKKILHMGSLNLIDEMDYPEECDILMLPYNGWEDNYTPAVNIIKRLKPKKILLHHFDNTFPPITYDLDLNDILKEDNIDALEYGTNEI